MHRHYELALDFDRIPYEIIARATKDGYIDPGELVCDDAQRFIELQIYWWLVKNSEREWDLSVIIDRCYTDIMRGAPKGKYGEDFVA